jgi:hypothetical protein
LYGGAMSALFVGAYSWSSSTTGPSSSTCKATSVSEVSVHVSDSGCSHCSAVSSSLGDSYGANSYGGAMSALFVGAYSWSSSNIGTRSSSTCEATSVSEVSVHVSDSGCSHCNSASNSVSVSYGANSYGGAMSALFVGAYSWSRSFNAYSSSMCEATSVSEVSVQVSDSGCSNCSAVSSSPRLSLGANSYGGAMSAYVGAYSYCISNGAAGMSCSASVTNTHVHLLSITIKRSSFQNSMALSGGCYSPTLNAKDLTRFEISETGFESKDESQGGVSYGANVSSSAVILPFSACDAASWRRVTLRRSTAAQSASRLGLMFGRLWDMEVPPHHAVPSSATSVVFSSMARQYKTALHCPTPPVLSLYHRRLLH